MKRTSTSLVIAFAIFGVAGCTGMAGGSDPSAPLTPLSRYSLQVEPGLDRIALSVHEAGLSASQHAAIGDLATRYGASGTGWVRIEAPAGEDPVAVRHAYAVRGALQAAGVPAESIQMVSYTAPDTRAPVLAGFETVRARVQNCSAEPRNLAGRFSNQSSSGFGCALTANMAAQIANPRDIVGARAMSPADSGRAAVVFDNYRRGQASSTPQEPLVDGRIARAVD